jgi:hypothetical protein
MTKLTSILFIFSLLSFQVSAGHSLYRGVKQYGQPSKYYDAYLPKGIEPRLTDIKKAILSKDILSIEDLLKKIQNDFPSYFKSFTLVKNSSSLQQSSPEFPRVILFGSTAKTLITFNGDSKHSGFKTLEIIEQTPMGDYEFREVREDKDKLVLSDKNPPKCMRCHSAELIPLWKSYPTWPNIYGEMDDELIAKESYLKFKKNIKKVKRYKNLIFDKSNWSSPFSPVSPQRNVEYQSLESRPNLRLTKLLARNHARFIYSRMAKLQGLNYRGADVLGKLLGCSNSVMTIGHESLFKQWGVDKFLYSLGGDQSGFFTGVYNLKTLVFEEIYRGLDNVNEVLPVSRWFEYHSSVPYLREGEFEEYSKWLVPGQRQDRYNLDFDRVVCRQLEKVKESNVKVDTDISTQFIDSAGPKVFQMCLSCHKYSHPKWKTISSQSVEFIDDFKELVEQRIHKSMPPDRRLSELELLAFKLWLKNL